MRRCRITVDEMMTGSDTGRVFTEFHERSRPRYGRGRLYDRRRDVASTREQCARFLKPMGKADPGLPDVEDARKRLAALGPR